MSLPTILLIALALAMDAFAVSIASGLAIQKLRMRHALAMAGCFGVFQAIMPLIGWAAGVRVRSLVSRVDHWIAFGLLVFIGGKMIWEGVKIESVEEKMNPWNIGVLLVLSVATSIDALAAGFGFALLNTAIATPVLIIGAVTFVTSFAGCWIGEKSGHFFERKIEIFGGLILIGIGAKILVSHL